MVERELNAIVTLRNEVSPWLTILQVAPDGWTLPDFKAGQCTSLGLPGSVSRCALAEPENPPADPNKLIRRMYCMASSPVNREFLEFYVALVPHGALSPRLFNLQIGDPIWLSEKVSGTFTFDQVPDEAHIVLIATGSGLAPYVSMLSTHLQFMTQRRVAVMHGVRHSWDLGYRSTFMTMQHLRTNFTYLPVVSRPEEEPVPWTGATGHVQDLWNGDALERAWGLRPEPDNTHVFLCGSPDMVEDMEEILMQEEFSEHTKNTPGQIHVEKYWQRAKVGKR
ncbi:MAG: ferredoxin--NADP reductase [Solirubrobacterales bacterium]